MATSLTEWIGLVEDFFVGGRTLSKTFHPASLSVWITRGKGGIAQSGFVAYQVWQRHGYVTAAAHLALY